MSLGPQWCRLRCFVNPVRRRISCLLSTQQFSTCPIRAHQIQTQERSSSDPEGEQTCGLVEEDIYYRPTADEITQLGFDKPNLRKATFTALCSTFSRHPDIIAVRQRIPPSDVVHFVKKKHQLGIEFNGDDAILNSECYKKEANFINICGHNLEINYDIGGFVPTKFLLKTKAFQSAESLHSYAKQSRDYGTIHNAIQDGWGDCTGRNALEVMMSRALNVCDYYRDILRLPRYEEPLRIYNVGGCSPRWAGIFNCNYAMLDDAQEENDVITDMRMSNQSYIAHRRKYIEESWDGFNEIASKMFVPDVSVFKLNSADNLFDIETLITVDIVDDGIDDIGLPQIRQAWNQALVGLQNSRSTYALIMSQYSAQLMKIEILDDETIFTSEKKYSFEACGSRLYQSEVLVELFSDLVRVLWEKNMTLK